MKLILPFSIACGIEAWYVGYDPKPQNSGYSYSLGSTEYLQQRETDNYVQKPNVVDNTYLDNIVSKRNPLSGTYLQGKDRLIYRHPSLDQNSDPSFIPVNRVKTPAVYLPPRGYNSASNRYKRPNNNWVSSNRYTSYSNGMRRPQGFGTAYQQQKPIVPIQKPVTTTTNDQTTDLSPQEQFEQVEYMMEESISNCLSNQKYNPITKLCDDIIIEETIIEEPIDETPTNVFGSPYKYFNRPTVNQPKGARYYDYLDGAWKYCPVGQYYNYRNKSCYEKSQKKWSLFG